MSKPPRIHPYSATGPAKELLAEVQKELGVDGGVLPAGVVGHVALNVLTDCFNILADVDIDWPVVQPHVRAA